MPSKQRNWTFQGVTSPNTTQVPDQYLDELLPMLSGAELKVLLYITRRTFGFKKDSDNISLSQMLNGITTRDGRVLDRGVGLTKKTLLQAIRSLEDKNIIITERRQSEERGNEATAYRLNIINGPPGVKTILPLGEKLPQGVGEEITPSPWGKNYPTQHTVIQNTVNNSVIVVTEALEDFGISYKVARRLAETHPEEDILHKIEVARWLQETNSPLITTSPAGFLRRSIEEAYTPPRNYKPKGQREEEEKNLQRAIEERKLFEDQVLEEKELTIQKLKKQHLPQPIPGSRLTTAKAWQKVLNYLKETITPANFHTFVKDTILLEVSNGYAVIGAPSRYSAEYIEKRLYNLIIRALDAVLDMDIKPRFEALSLGSE